VEWLLIVNWWTAVELVAIHLMLLISQTLSGSFRFADPLTECGMTANRNFEDLPARATEQTASDALLGGA